MAIGEVGEFSSLSLGNNPNDPSDRARLFYAGTQQLATDGALKIDRDDTNNGSLSLGLTFGSTGSEGIASQRTAGGNQNGLDFYTSSAARLSITSTGDVGIGTKTPSEKLEVVGNIKTTQLEASGIVKAASLQGDGSALTGKVSTTGDTMTGPLTIQNALTVSGSVGIGTTNPATKIEVYGGRLRVSKSDANGAGVIELSNGSKTNYLFTDGATGDLFLRTDSANHDLILQGSDAQGNVGIGTTNPTYKLEVTGDVKASSIHSKQKIFSFKVDGDFDKFYPIIFNDDNWHDGATVLEINRPNIHTDSEWRGALNSKFTFHSTAWGHGADFCRTEIYYSAIPFIAGYQNYYFNPHFVVWLRGGGTTYYWKSNSLVTLEDYSAKEKNVKIEGYEQSSVNYPAKTNIDSYVQSSGIYLDKNFGVNGQVFVQGRLLNGSSRELKENIADLSVEEAVKTLEGLNPVTFNYRTGKKEDISVGFIAEDVPELVATPDRKGLSSMEIVAVLTKVIKEQQKIISVLAKNLESLEK